MTTVSLVPLYDQVVNNPLLDLASGLAVWIVKEFVSVLKKHATFLDAKTDAALGDVLDKALANGIIYGQQLLNKEEAAHQAVDVNGFIASHAAQYAIDHAPAVVQRLTGSDPEKLAQMALARLPKVTSAQK